MDSPDVEFKVGSLRWRSDRYGERASVHAEPVKAEVLEAGGKPFGVIELRMGAAKLSLFLTAEGLEALAQMAVAALAELEEHRTGSGDKSAPEVAE